MEVSGVVFRPLPSFSGAGIDAHSHHSSPKPSFAGARIKVPGEIRQLGLRETRVSIKPRKFSGFLDSGFSDDGHLRYYNGPSAAVSSTTRGGGGKKEKDTTVKKMKKKLKLLKGLKKDLSMFSQMGFGLDPDHDLADQVKGKMISEATELLLQQLQQLKAEEKELKRKRKEEKAKLKFMQMQMQNIPNCELSSSDSSSESSDSECEQVIDMNQLKAEATSSITDAVQPLIQEPTQLVNPAEPPVLADERVSSDICCSGSCSETTPSNVVNVGCTSRKIEVCMGGKCKKSGALALMEEFRSRVGGEGSVVGCKCMGKCRDGPNVMVLNNVVEAEGVDGSVRAPANPLCIGVGLEDVGLIVDNFFGGNRKDLGLVGAS